MIWGRNSSCNINYITCTRSIPNYIQPYLNFVFEWKCIASGEGQTGHVGDLSIVKCGCLGLRVEYRDLLKINARRSSVGPFVFCESLAFAVSGPDLRTGFKAL
jgi:hypothetical protein